MNQSTSIKTVLNDRLGPPSGAPRPSKEIAMKTTLSLLAAQMNDSARTPAVH